MTEVGKMEQIDAQTFTDALETLSKIEQKLDSILDDKTNSLKVEVHEQLLTTAQVAEMLQVTRQTLHVWNKKGVLKGVRIGTRIRYKLSEVENYIQSTNLKTAYHEN